MNYGITIKNEIKIIQWVNEGLSAYRIAKNLNCAKSSVLKFLENRGLKTQHKSKLDPNKPTLKSRTNEVVKLYQSGMSHKQIAEMSGHSSSQVCTLLQRENIPARPNNIYDVDETFFQKIDNEKKAYVLGWFYSDGNVINKGKIRICLNQKDEEILHKIKDIMKYTGPLYYKEARNTSEPQVELCINRKCLSNQLIKLGCFPNKSLKLIFPTKEQVPTHLLHHFVRGFFDGDGSITNSIMITGSFHFIYSLKDYLPCNITNIYQRYKDRLPEKSSHQLFIGRKKEYQKFLTWLYKDATIYLQRKYDKAESNLNIAR